MAGALRVLLVEDSAADAELIVRHLETAGFDLDCRRVETARDYLEHLDATLDVILFEFTMPQFDATRALQSLEACGLDVPLIIISGNIGEAAVADCLKHGAVDFVLKSHLARLGPAAEQAIARRRAHAEERRADRALRESEARYRRIVETAQEGIWEVDVEHRTTFANQKLADMLATTVDKMCGVPIFAFMDDEGQAIATASLEQCLLGMSERSEWKLRREDGGDLWAIVAANPIVDEAGRYVGTVALVTGITDRKRAEEAQTLAHVRSWEFSLASGRPRAEQAREHLYRELLERDRHLYRELLEREERLREMVEQILRGQEVSRHKEQAATQQLLQLTPREREILRLLARGRTNQEIGQALCLSRGTVRNHVSRLLRKLGVADRTQAVVFAYEGGLLD